MCPSGGGERRDVVPFSGENIFFFLGGGGGYCTSNALSTLKCIHIFLKMEMFPPFSKKYTSVHSIFKFSLPIHMKMLMQWKFMMVSLTEHVYNNLINKFISLCTVSFVRPDPESPWCS